jgi:hypothetical protein
VKKFTVFFCSVILVLGAVGFAGATPVYFDVAGGSVTLSNIDSYPIGWTSLSAATVPTLSNESFTIADGGTQSIEFFTLTASGLGVGSANISASLFFTTPVGLIGSGSGEAEWGTFFGMISGGKLTWDANTLPDVVTLADGNVVSIDFEDGIEIGLGDTATVHAYISNHGGGAGGAPVPEPATMFLLGSGMLGLVAVGRKRFNKKC